MFHQKICLYNTHIKEQRVSFYGIGEVLCTLKIYESFVNVPKKQTNAQVVAIVRTIRTPVRVINFRT